MCGCCCGAAAAALLASAPTAGAQEAPAVIVSEAVRISFPVTVEAIGTAHANEAVEIRAKISETIRAIRFEEGQRVEAGSVLVELEDATAAAALAAAEARLVESRGQYRRGQELFESSLIAASDLETLAAKRDADRADVDAARARMAETVVRAPFAGRVGLRRVSPGSLVTPSRVITTLDDTDTIKLDFDVPETALSQIATGVPVVARSAAWPDEPLEGRVASIDTRVDPVSRTITVRALIPNPTGRLRPGMFLAVELRRDDVHAIVVPEQATLPDQSRHFVLVVGEDGIVEKRQVHLGRRRPGQVEIVSGLAAGEVVVVEGTQKAQPGMRVRTVDRVEVGS